MSHPCDVNICKILLGMKAGTCLQITAYAQQPIYGVWHLRRSSLWEGVELAIDMPDTVRWDEKNDKNPRGTVRFSYHSDSVGHLRRSSLWEGVELAIDMPDTVRWDEKNEKNNDQNPTGQCQV